MFPGLLTVVCVLVCLILIPWVPIGASSPTVTVPAGIACGDVVRQQLEAWGARDEMRRISEGPTDVARYVWPTARIGVWLDLRLSRDGSLRLARVAPDRTTELVWSTECRASPKENAPVSGAQNPDAFHDADLEALLDAPHPVVVYVWSPHMPLSVDGVQQASTAVQRLGLQMVVLASPDSDRAYVNRVAQDAGLPDGAGRQVNSIELLFRDVLVHAPTVQLFVDGRAAGPAIPGYRNAAEYEYLWRRQLGQREKGTP